MSLPSIIEIDKDKCVNCHRCISVCPVKFCNNGNGEHISLNADLCIGCGECLKACEHEARIPIDDFIQAFKALEQREKIVAIVAPGVAANFPNQYLNLNGYLKSLGVSAIFDVSFGAELTVTSYLDYIKNANPKMVIAQPCPAIVSYIEIYQPELLPYLAPADSPMLHTIKMVKNFYPQYAQHKSIIISPCIAKKREFDAVGLGDYNVTMTSLSQYIKKNNIHLGKYQALEYDNDPAERAVLFSTPGGLLRTALREVPGIEQKTRKIEGPHVIYDYLKQLPKDLARKTNPLLIDCLNCDKGCNGGTGTESKDESVDYLEYLIEERQKHAVAFYLEKNPEQTPSAALEKIRETVATYWKPEIYQRKYTDRSAHHSLKIPQDSALEKIYGDLLKFNEEDFKNCSNCGYNSCDKMATAIFNGLNKIENCHLYLQKTIELDKQNLSDLSLQMNKSIEELHQNEILNSNDMISNMIKVMDNIVEMASISYSLVQRLGENNALIKKHLQDIFKISKKTNLLSINASIESSKAGVYGRGFNVVAGEIKALSAHTNSFTKEIDKLAIMIKKNTNEIEQAIIVKKEEVEKGKIIAVDLSTILKNISDKTSDLKKYRLE